jgi:hypothetical protein
MVKLGILNWLHLYSQEFADTSLKYLHNSNLNNFYFLKNKNPVGFVVTCNLWGSPNHGLVSREDDLKNNPSFTNRISLREVSISEYRY